MTQNSDDRYAPNRLLAVQACAQYNEPSHHMDIYGVTGTNGKTTSTYLLEGLLKAKGERPAIIGTIENRLENYRVLTEFTTPTSPLLQKLLADFRVRGATAVAMEVSSHGIHQYRTWGMRFKGAIFTNLTQDHLDYHNTMDEYFSVKARLFLEYPLEHRVIHQDDPWGQKLMALCQKAGHKFVTFGKFNANINYEKLKNHLSGLTGPLVVQYENKTYEIEIHSPLVGWYNAQNIAGVAALGVSLGLSPQTISQGIQQARPVKGRMERVSNPKNHSIFIDYAHTPDGLEKALNALKEISPARLMVVFGCGGDRDPFKRPKMGAIAEALAQEVFVTSDNPRTEDPQKIIDQILEGMKAPQNAHATTDRRQAIYNALAQTSSQDILLIAGKGHEDYQIIGTEKRPFDDRLVIEDFYKLNT